MHWIIIINYGITNSGLDNFLLINLFIHYIYNLFNRHAPCHTSFMSYIFAYYCFFKYNSIWQKILCFSQSRLVCATFINKGHNCDYLLFFSIN